MEKSNKIGYLDTAARAYFDNGQKEKAIELYETRILSLARAVCSSCESFYKKMKDIKHKKRQKALLKKLQGNAK